MAQPAIDRGAGASAHEKIAELKRRVKALEKTPTVIDQLDGAAISPGTVDAGSIVSGSITSDQIAAGAITADELAAGAVTANAIAANAITAGAITAGAITAGKIQAGAVTATTIAAGAITATHIGANTVNAGHVQAGSIGAAHISAGAITTAHLSAGAITAQTIAAGAITAVHIKANEIDAGHIRANSINAGHVQAGSIGTNQLAANSITSNIIQSGVITATHIAAASISGDRIQADAITAREITGTTLSSIFSDMGNLTAGTITGGTFQTAASGSRVVLNTSGVTGYASNGTTETFRINTATGQVTLTGIVYADATSTIPAGTLTGTIAAPRLPTIGGTNSVLNSALASDFTSWTGTTGWTTETPGGSLPASPISASAKLGRYVHAGGSTVYPGIIQSAIPVVGGRQYTGSAYFNRTVTGNCDIVVVWRNAANAATTVKFVEWTSVPAGSWQRLSGSLTAPSDAVTAEITIRSELGTTAQTVYITGMQVEEGAVATAWGPKPDEILPGVITGALIPPIGGTNILRNASFEGVSSGTTLSDWTNSSSHISSGATITRDNAGSYVNAYDGSYYARVVTSAIGQGISQSVQGTSAPSTTMTFSAYAKKPATGGATAIKFHAVDTGGSAPASGSPTFTLTTSWQRFTWTMTLPAGWNGTGQFGVSAQTLAGEFHLDAIQVEAGSVATGWGMRPDDIIADSISGTMIGSNAIATRHVSSGTITAQQLTVGLPNAAGAFTNGNFQSGTNNWTGITADHTTQTDTTFGKVLQINHATAKNQNAYQDVNLPKGRHVITWWQRTTSVTPGQFYCYLQQASGTVTVSNPASGQTGTQDWAQFQAVADVTTTTGTVRLNANLGYGGPSTGTAFLAALSIMSSVGATTITPSSITTTHIEAQGIKAASIYAGAVQADLIGANNIRAGAISANKLSISPASSVYLTNMTGSDPTHAADSIPGWTRSGSTWTIATDQIRTQPQSFKFVGTANGTLSQSATLPAGSYTWECWVRTSGVTGSVMPLVYVNSGTVSTESEINYINTPDAYGSARHITGTTEWTLLRRSFTVTSATASLDFFMRADITAGTAWFNDPRIINALHYTEITPGTIRSPQIATGEIKTVNIASSAVTANEIKSGAITTQQLSVAMPGGSGVSFNNGTFQAGDLGTTPTITVPNWTVNAGTVTIAADTVFGRKMTTVTGTANAGLWQDVVMPKGRHVVSVWAQAASGTARLTLSTTSGTATFTTPADVTAADWTLMTGTVTVSSATATVRILLQNLVTTGTVSFANTTVQSSIGATLITPNSITTDQITAGTIKAESLWGGRVGATLIEGQNILADTITANKLTVGVRGSNIPAPYMTTDFEQMAVGSQPGTWSSTAGATAWWSMDNPQYYMNGSGASTVVDTATTAPYSGTKCLRVVTVANYPLEGTAMNNIPGPDNGVWKAGQKYTASVYVKAPSATSLNFWFGSQTPGQQGSALTNQAIPTGWTRYTVTWTPDADRAMAKFICYTADAGAVARTWYMDNVQIERGSEATPYTALGDGLITGTQITPGTISTTHIATSSITADKINFRVAGRNVASDSSFEANPNGTQIANPSYGWASFWSGAGAFVSTSYKRSGTKSISIAPSSGIYRDFTFTDLPVGTKITCSVYVRSATGGTAVPQMHVHDTLGTAGTATTVYLPNSAAATTDWQRLTHTYTLTATKALRLHLYGSSDYPSSQTGLLHYDDLQVEVGDVATEWSQYIDPTVIDGSSITAATYKTNASGQTYLQIDDGGGLRVFNSGVLTAQMRPGAGGLDLTAGGSQYSGSPEDRNVRWIDPNYTGGIAGKITVSAPAKWAGATNRYVNMKSIAIRPQETYTGHTNWASSALAVHEPDGTQRVEFYTHASDAERGIYTSGVTPSILSRGTDNYSSWALRSHSGCTSLYSAGGWSNVVFANVYFRGSKGAKGIVSMEGYVGSGAGHNYDFYYPDGYLVAQPYHFHNVAGVHQVYQAQPFDVPDVGPGNYNVHTYRTHSNMNDDSNDRMCFTIHEFGDAA